MSSGTPSSPGTLTPTAIRDGDPFALALLVERRGGPVLAYADELTPPDRALTATAEAFAQFREAVVAAADPNALDPETALLEATRASVARHAENPYRPAGRERPARRTRTCELMPRLLVAWTDGRLSIDDEHRLVRHLRGCVDCRALNDAFARAEERYVSGPPAAMDAAEVAMVVSSTVATAATPVPVAPAPTPAAPVAPEAIPPAPVVPPPIDLADDALLATAHASPDPPEDDLAAPGHEAAPHVDAPLATEPDAAPGTASTAPGTVGDATPDPEASPTPDPEATTSWSVDGAMGTPSGSSSDAADAREVAPEDRAAEPASPSPEPVVPEVPVAEPATAEPVIPEPPSAPTAPAPRAPRARGGGFGAAALRRVVGAPGSLGRLVHGGESRDVESERAARDADPADDGPGTPLEDAAATVTDPTPAGRSPAPAPTATPESDDAAPPAADDPDPAPRADHDEPGGDWSTVFLAVDDPVGPEALGYVVPRPGMPKPVRVPPRRRAPRPPAPLDHVPTAPEVGPEHPGTPAPEVVPSPVSGSEAATPAPTDGDGGAWDDGAVDEHEDPDASRHDDPFAEDPFADDPATAVHPVATPVGEPGPDEAARWVTGASTDQQPAVAAAVPATPVAPATIEQDPTRRSSTTVAVVVRQLGVPAVLLVLVVVAALVAAGAFSSDDDSGTSPAGTTPLTLPSSPQQIPSVTAPR